MIAVVYVCWAAFLLTWAGGYLYNVARAPRSVEARGGLGLSGWIWRLVVAAALILLGARRESALGLLALSADSPLAVGLGGAVVLIASTAFTLWARFSLGTMWSSTPTIKEGHRLRTDGPYGITRHPIYTGMLGMFLGTTLVTGALLVLLGSLAFAVYVAGKISTEERLLTATFGSEYALYRRTVPALIPFLRRR